MKILKHNTLILQVADDITRVNHEGKDNVIKVTKNGLTPFYIATNDRDEYVIEDRNDIPNDYYPSGYHLSGDTWTYIEPPQLPDPSELI